MRRARTACRGARAVDAPVLLFEDPVLDEHLPSLCTLDATERLTESVPLVRDVVGVYKVISRPPWGRACARVVL